MGPYLAIAAMIVVLYGLVFLAGIIRNKRSKKIQAVATQLGLKYFRDDRVGFLGQLSIFELFQRGHKKGLENISCGHVGETEIILLDFEYLIFRVRRGESHRQTVIVFAEHFLLPEFVAGPRSLLEKVAATFGSSDIDIPSHPTFSRGHFLRGPEPDKIRRLFSSPVASFFEANPGLSIESKGNKFVLYEFRKSVKPERWGEWMETGKEALALLTAHAR